MTGVPKPRKPRPSRARGLRTTTGCLTCRRRRVKCDELRPRCATCTKSARDCQYVSPNDPQAESKPGDSILSPTLASASSAPGDSSAASVKSASPLIARKSVASEIDQSQFSNSPELLFDSPSTNLASVPSPNSAPLEWYDLLAEDAINNIDKYNLNLELDRTVLSRRQSPAPESKIDPQLQSPREEEHVDSSLDEQWNSPENIPIGDDELILLRHYINVVGPILDLCDPSRQFTTTVPGLAVHNVGLLKSLLAVAARHMALTGEPQLHKLSINPQTPGSTISDSNNSTVPLLNISTQYYYETLHYLSQNLLYPSYSKSREIIATALLISTYEMFDAENQYSNGAWERHLRGIFWIQRAQNNNGESKDPLRRAAWWCWLRQDSWVAFREGRRVLTIWRPTKRLMDLTPDELCLRIMYICGRCVDYAANEKKYDMNTRIDQGGKLLRALEDWHNALPSTFKPIYRPVGVLPEPGNLFSPIWIHPPSYAAAIQTFHFSRIIVLINQPSLGGMDDFRVRQRLLDESVETVCGIAMMHQGEDAGSTFIDVRALYAAGLCVQSPAKQNTVFHLLEKTLQLTNFPSKKLTIDLVNYWRAESQ